MTPQEAEDLALFARSPRFWPSTCGCRTTSDTPAWTLTGRGSCPTSQGCVITRSRIGATPAGPDQTPCPDGVCTGAIRLTPEADWMGDLIWRHVITGDVRCHYKATPPPFRPVLVGVASQTCIDVDAPPHERAPELSAQSAAIDAGRAADPKGPSSPSTFPSDGA